MNVLIICHNCEHLTSVRAALVGMRDLFLTALTVAEAAERSIGDRNIFKINQEKIKSQSKMALAHFCSGTNVIYVMMSYSFSVINHALKISPKVKLTRPTSNIIAQRLT